jgi:flagellar biosynthetic protein FlhB
MADNENDGQLRQEEPTQRRLEKAREEGQVTRSREVGYFFFLMAALLLMGFYGSRLVTGLKEDMALYFQESATTKLTPDTLTPFVKEIFFHELSSSFPVFLIFLLFSVGAFVVQGGFLFTPKAAAIKWNRISPAQGLKRIFSVRALEELFRYTLKVVLSLVILFYALQRNWLELPALVETGAHRMVGELYRMTFVVLVAFLPLYAFLAAGDYLFQRFVLMRSLRMSRTEIKEETKETEGDPHVRARIRSIQRAMARRRIMSKIKQATVVITNPTHFAVALRYDPETMVAPVVIAKGMDEIALRFREVAQEVGVPVVEDPPLARGLYRDCPLDREIPVSFYEAVARVLSVLYQKSGSMNPVAKG